MPAKAEVTRRCGKEFALWWRRQPMASVQVTADSFDATVASGIVLLDFWAGWCGPCKMFAPIFEAASENHPDIVFGKVDTDAEQELAARFSVRTIPTLMVIRDGILLAAQPGVMPAAAVEELIRKVRALDMDEVRQKVTAENRV
jgi:thioredoxin 1